MRHEVLTQRWLIDVSLSWSSFWRIQHCRQIRHVNTLLSQHKSLIRCKSFNKNPVYTYLVFFNIRIKTPVTVNNIYFMYSTMDETVNSFLVHCCFYSIILGPDTGYEQSSNIFSGVAAHRKIHYDHLVWTLDDGRFLKLFCLERLIFLMRWMIVKRY